MHWCTHILFRKWNWCYVDRCDNPVYANANNLQVADANVAEGSGHRHSALGKFVCCFLFVRLWDWFWLILFSVCVASICRIVALQKNTQGTDATWTMAPVFIWSCVEPFVGIICACLPTFGPFFRRWWAKARTGRSSNSRSNDPSASYPSATTSWLRKPRAKKPPMDSLFSINDFGCVDEVELMNDINATRSLRDEAVSDHHDVERGDSCAITVQQDVDVTWDKCKTGRKWWSGRSSEKYTFHLFFCV